ncbi:MAG: hypothetical protein KBA81_06905 [Rhabdochlamydiaceae bacterium]|nr:hypothetical protein [Rhabdochlamydiaceae bacterium]
MNNPKDEAASEFEKAYEEFRHKHINASFMPKEMAKFMFLAGRASKDIRFPSKEVIKNARDTLQYTGDRYAFDKAVEWAIEQIKALNECEGI